MKVRQLFGTDGVRGVAGEFPLDPKTVHALGAALGDVAGRLDAGAGDCDRHGHTGVGPVDCRAGGRGADGARRFRSLRRRDHNPGRCLPHAHEYVRGRRDDFGLAQPLPRQRDQDLQPFRIQASRRAGARHRAGDVRPARSGCSARAGHTDPGFRPRPALHQLPGIHSWAFVLGPEPGDRLRQRGGVRTRRGAVRAAGRLRDGRELYAGRAQHQPRLRGAARREATAGCGGPRRRYGGRFRRRRRPRHLRLALRAGRGRRCGFADVREGASCEGAGLRDPAGGPRWWPP